MARHSYFFNGWSTVWEKYFNRSDQYGIFIIQLSYWDPWGIYDSIIFEKEKEKNSEKKVRDAKTKLPYQPCQQVYKRVRVTFSIFSLIDGILTCLQGRKNAIMRLVPWAINSTYPQPFALYSASTCASSRVSTRWHFPCYNLVLSLIYLLFMNQIREHT